MMPRPMRRLRGLKAQASFERGGEAVGRELDLPDNVGVEDVGEDGAKWLTGSTADGFLAGLGLP